MRTIAKQVYDALVNVYYKLFWKSLVRKVEQLRRADTKPIFILGTPIHRNIGDLAIAYAEVKFVDNMPGFKAVPVSVPCIMANKKKLSKLIKDTDTLAGHGGGNLGDTYPKEEDIRRFILQEFPHNKVFIFPQTIHFSDADYGQSFKNESAGIYKKHADLTIIAREQKSYKLAKGVFSNKVILTPDIVLSLAVDNTTDEGCERNGVLLCLRNDIEKTLGVTDHEKIMKFAGKVSPDITVTDTISSDKMFIVKRRDRIVKNKFDEFRSAQLVITDRLHGMVFAAVTGTPCIVFSNFNHKVQGTYEWISNLKYIHYCRTVEDLERIDIASIGVLGSAHDPKLFDKYWHIIQNEIRGGE